MNTSISASPATVAGVASDPQLRLADGSRSSLGFFTDLGSRCRVLDVGCGDGKHLKVLAQRGCQVIGIESDPRAVSSLRQQGFHVVHGTAEELPFENAAFDAIVCSVVVPYTDERSAIAEWSRVLVPRGQVRASYHGLGYALKFLLAGPGVRRRVYGGRTIANSCMYSLTGRRLPGFWGDTLYQSPCRLRRYYQKSGLSLLTEYVRPTLGGLRDIFFHHLRKEV